MVEAIFITIIYVHLFIIIFFFPTLRTRVVIPDIVITTLRLPICITRMLFFFYNGAAKQCGRYEIPGKIRFRKKNIFFFKFTSEQILFGGIKSWFKFSELFNLICLKFELKILRSIILLDIRSTKRF